MLALVTFFAVITLVTSASSGTDLEGYSFEQFLKEFNVKYSENELPTRRTIFEKELARVKAHNSKNLSWKEGVTKFSAMTEQEKRSYLGLAKGPKKSLKTRTFNKTITLPESWDWRNKQPSIISAVKDQGHCGSCWAFAATATIESHVALATEKLFDLSVQQIAFCAPNSNHCGGTGGCAGSTPELAFEYVTTSAGLYQEYQYPYLGYNGVNSNCSIPTGAAKATIKDYVQLTENNYDDLIYAVATVGPIAVSVDASTWHSYVSGIFNGCNQQNPDINHAVVLVGYGTDESTGQKYWIIRNSWSPTFGENGYIRLLRQSAEDTTCGVDLTPQDGSACEGDNEPKTVCGTCGVLYDSSYPLNAQLV